MSSPLAISEDMFDFFMEVHDTMFDSSRLMASEIEFRDRVAQIMCRTPLTRADLVILATLCGTAAMGYDPRPVPGPLNTLNTLLEEANGGRPSGQG